MLCQGQERKGKLGVVSRTGTKGLACCCVKDRNARVSLVLCQGHEQKGKLRAVSGHHRKGVFRVELCQ